MAVTYSASGNGSDINKLATLISAFNGERKNYLTNTTDGLVGKILADLNTHFKTNGLNQDGSTVMENLEGEIGSRRFALVDRRAFYKSAIDAYLQSKIARDTDAFSSSLQDVFDALYADMIANSKVFDDAAGSIAEASATTHINVSAIHAQETWVNAGTVKTVRYFSDLSSETLVARVTTPQNSQGAGALTLSGFYKAGDAGTFPDQAGGWGDIGTLQYTGWNQGGLVLNNKASSTAQSADEFAQYWRPFTANPDSNAPVTGRVIRETTAGVPYHANSCFKFVGDNAVTDIYAATIINNPNQDLNTTAWGTNANVAPVARMTPNQEGQVLFVSFYYRNLPSGYTLLPKLISNGSIIAHDEVVRDTVKDNSNTWRLAKFAFVVDKGVAVERLLFAMHLYNGGSAIAAAFTTRFDVLKVEFGTVLGNFWFHGQPSQVPLGRDAEESFTLTQSSATKWETYWARNYTDRFGQRLQLRASGSPSEAEALILFADE